MNKLAQLKYIKFDELEKNKKYAIVRFGVFVDSKFNNKTNCVKVILPEGYLILPRRFNELLEGDQLSRMNSEKMVMIYKGKNQNTHDIEFEKQENY